MNYELIETDSRNNDFCELIKILDKDLEGRYGELQKQYEKHNKVDFIKNVVIVYKDKVPVACGAYKEFDTCSAEIKRVFVKKEFRNQGFARIIMNRLEELIKSSNYKYSILETGIKQHEAISLYKKVGYNVIENYGPYIGNSNSVCMKKVLLHIALEV